MKTEQEHDFDLGIMDSMALNTSMQPLNAKQWVTGGFEHQWEKVCLPWNFPAGICYPLILERTTTS